jgi:hypothetical protein
MPKKPKAKIVEKFDEKYYIISKDSTNELSRRVRKMMESGARPIGGVVSDFGPDGKMYVQALIFD